MKTMLITPEGLEKLKAELDHLWKVERPETTQKVAWAASLGDRSENADYHYNKRRLREIDKRVHYLRKCLDDLKVVEYAPYQEGKVMFGAWVEVENSKGQKSASALWAERRFLSAGTISQSIRPWRRPCSKRRLVTKPSCKRQPSNLFGGYRRLSIRSRLNDHSFYLIAVSFPKVSGLKKFDRIVE
jgi:transcription elongation factor GreB